ncbi:MAG: S1/P1 nuclease [Pseudohongiellaceae bacterium]
MGGRHLVLASLLLCCTRVFAWDGVGHRLSVEVAIRFMSPSSLGELQEILQHHPRFEEDFLDRMPVSVRAAGPERRITWLLGQAAFWPDLARGLPDAEADRYNRPAWHYIDGAWVRGGLLDENLQGNVYINTERLPNVSGEPAASIQSERDADNIVTALDFNTRVLLDQSADDGDRAIALCWLLHLAGDIHQPLHAGSLYSATVFADGDRGGNAIPTSDGPLHARWDRALSGAPMTQTLALLMDEADALQARVSRETLSWETWLEESREILQTDVYEGDVRRNVLNAERVRGRVAVTELDSAYLARMQSIALRRISLAGLRMATWIDRNLPNQ